MLIDNNRLKSIFNDKSMLYSFLEKAFLVIILFRAGTLLFFDSEKIAQSHIDRFAWGGLVYIFGALLITFRIDLKNKWLYIAGAVYCLVYGGYCLSTGYFGYAPDIVKVMFRQGIVFGMLVVLVTDAICKKAFCRLREIDISKVALFGLAILGILAFSEDYHNLTILGIFVICALISFDSKRVENLIICFAVSNILGTTYVACLSFLAVPYTGEARYYGIFTYLHGYGMYIGSGIVCCIFLIVCGYRKKWNMKRLLCIVLPFLGFETFTFVVVNSRSALLGIIALAIVFGCVMLSKIKRKKIAVGIVLAVIVAVATFVGAIVYLGVNYDSHLDFMEANKALAFYASVMSRTLRSDYSVGIFPAGTLPNAIDTFTNQRLSIWKRIVDQLKWFGGNSGYIKVTEEWTTGPHSTYMGYLNMWGIVVGTLYCVALFYVLVKAAKLLKKNSENGIALFGLMWYVFSLAVFINEMVHFYGFLAVVCMLIMAVLPKTAIATGDERNEELRGNPLR